MSDLSEPTESCELADNANVRNMTRLPPMLLEQIREDPENSRPLYRSMKAIMDFELYSIRNSLPPSQRMALSEMYGKTGGMNPKESAAQTNTMPFSININIPPMDALEQKVITIDQTFDAPLVALDIPDAA